MRHLPALLFAIALACLAFGWWGLNTTAGNHMFDEMAGIVPFAVGVLGWVLVLAAVALLVLRRKRR